MIINCVCVPVFDGGTGQSKHSLEKRREASSGSVVMPLSPSSNIIILSWLLLFRQVPGWQQASKLCRSSTCRERTTASTSASLPGQPISLHRFVVKVVLIDITISTGIVRRKASCMANKTSQELRMLSIVTINCQVTKIVMNSGSQLSEL